MSVGVGECLAESTQSTVRDAPVSGSTAIVVAGDAAGSMYQKPALAEQVQEKGARSFLPTAWQGLFMYEQHHIPCSASYAHSPTLVVPMIIGGQRSCSRVVFRCISKWTTTMCMPIGEPRTIQEFFMFNKKDVQ